MSALGIAHIDRLTRSGEVGLIGQMASQGCSRVGVAGGGFEILE